MLNPAIRNIRVIDLAPLPAELLPHGIRSRFIDGINGLRFHILEAGHDRGDRPLLLLLHGFPELAYSWRKTMLPLAEAGFHVVAPDQRGYGRTTGWSDAYDQDLKPFSMLRLAGDMLALVYALGHRRAASVIGHDFGASVAPWCALTRPDVFRSCVMMSAPFAGPAAIAIAGSVPAPQPATHRPLASADLAAALAGLPRPRKHYQWYYATRDANGDMCASPQGMQAFLRAYFHHKSADWKGNRPFRLRDGTAEQIAQMPTYYIMDLHETMPETVARHMPSSEAIAGCAWLPEAEMSIYAREYERTGFQGGLNWYRARMDAGTLDDQGLYANRTLDVPSMFISGAQDWGTYQVPGAVERMQTTACSRMIGVHLVEGAGHWVMQEQAGAVNSLLTGALAGPLKN